MSPSAGRRRKITRIGRYRVIRALEGGGMDAVFLAHDPLLNRRVILKLCRLEGEGDTAQRELRFRREVMVTAQLQHPGIPPVYGFRRRADGSLFYVMQPIEGRPLAGILQELREGRGETADRFDLFHLVEIFRGICQTVHYCHSRGVIHRDLKPSNISVGEFGEVYVLDWGLTKILDRGLRKDIDDTPAELEPGRDLSDLGEETRLDEPETADDAGSPEADSARTLVGTIMGTPAYMPPEQASGAVEEHGIHSDIYSLGAILYELLTLRPPVTHPDVSAMLAAKARDAIIPPEQRAPERMIPPALSALAMHAMSSDPAKRYKSVRTMIGEIDDWLEGRPQWGNPIQVSAGPGDLEAIPPQAESGWQVDGGEIQSVDYAGEGQAYLLFRLAEPGHLRWSCRFYIEGDETANDIRSECAVVLSAMTPEPWRGVLDAYVIRLGADRNTRVVISKNDVEVAANDYVVIEPWRRYSLSIERVDREIRVMLDRQTILLYKEGNPLPGLQTGWLHRGPGVHASGFRFQFRGVPAKVSMLEIPEALMAEGCYAGALKQYLSIAQTHRDRPEGAQARYRAALAAFRLNRDSRAAFKILRPLQKGPFAVFAQLGLAQIELERGRSTNAARLVGGMLKGRAAHPYLDPVADFVFGRIYDLFRGRSAQATRWEDFDAWIRLGLILGDQRADKQSTLPAMLWQWLSLALTEHPDHLPDCIAFLRTHFGRRRGAFAEILTGLDVLMMLLKRSQGLSDNAFLQRKVMRLILAHDDHLGNLETIFRFYLQAGNEGIALRLAHHIERLCGSLRISIPPAPLIYTAAHHWLNGRPDLAQGCWERLVEQSTDWGPPDGRIFMGLEAFARGEESRAEHYWRALLYDDAAITHNRHFVALGLLDELPVEFILADIPNRSDHRLLFCLMVAYKRMLAFEREGRAADREAGLKYLHEALKMRRPSYDLYGAADLFYRRPLQRLGDSQTLPPREAVPLTAQEKAWLEQLAAAALGGEAPTSGVDPEGLETRCD